MDSTLTRLRARRDEGGTILVIAVLLIMLLIVIVTDAASVARVEWEATSNADLDLQIDLALQGGFEIAKAYLVDDLENAPDVDTLLEEWAIAEGIEKEIPLGESSSAASGQESAAPKLRIFIEDEERKWPLPLLKLGNDAVKERRKEGLANVIDDFRRGTALDVDASAATSYAEMIANFLNRKEDDQNFGKTPRPLTKSGSLLNTTDLALIAGLPPSVVFDQVDPEDGTVMPGLINYVTLWTDLVVNVNTAPEPVLRGLFRRRDDEVSVGTDIYTKRNSASDEFLEKEARESGGTSGDRFQRERERRRQQQEEASRTGGEGNRAGRAAGAGKAASGEEEFGGVFESIEDVKKEVVTLVDRLFNEISTTMTVKSSTFCIWVEAEFRGVRKVRRWVIRRDGARALMVLSEQVDWPRFRRPTEKEQQRLEDR